MIRLNKKETLIANLSPDFDASAPSVSLFKIIGSNLIKS